MRGTVLCGADRLTAAAPLLRGRRCGLLCSASGVDRNGVPTYVNLAEKYNLTVLFAPEHGIHSVLQDGGWGGEATDPETGVPVYNLPAKGNPEIGNALSLCDIVVYDIQDVGARFYTYIYCLTYLMTECAARGIPVLVLDRPDPVSGSMNAVEGAILDEATCSSFVGRYSLPARYSLTCGEFARYINGTRNIGCELYVLQCENWQRGMYGDETGLPWINPSPNIPGVSCAVNYIGICLIEATNLSEGRGTTRPFDIVGAPFVDSRSLAGHMNSLRLPGISFSRAFFTPVFNKHAGAVCEGVQLNITDREAYRPHMTGLYLLAALREYPGFEWRERGVCLRYGTDALTREESFDPAVITRDEAAGTAGYVSAVADYLIY